jgi:hypothetical protein
MPAMCSHCRENQKQKKQVFYETHSDAEIG